MQCSERLAFTMLFKVEAEMLVCNCRFRCQIVNDHIHVFLGSLLDKLTLLVKANDLYEEACSPFSHKFVFNVM